MKDLVRSIGVALLLVLLMTWIFYGAVASADIPFSLKAAQNVAQPGGIVTVTAAGDVMFTRGVGRNVEKFGVMYPLEKMTSELRSGDITFVNLETAVSSRGVPLPGKGIWFRSPPQSVAALKSVGIDIVSLANNHSMDYDAPAFYDTLSLLQEGGIETVGGGKDLAAARKPVILKVGGTSIAFLAYSEMADIYWDSAYPRSLQATETLPGIAPLKEDVIEEDLARLQSANLADIVIISLHWGEEYTKMPTLAQRELAHRIIDAGADVIVGHHPHWFQGVEYYKEGLITYSLGNFLFDQTWSVETQQGLLLKLEFSRLGLLAATLKPVFTPGTQTEIAKSQMAVDILGQLQRLSAGMDTKVEIVDGTARVVGSM